MCRADPMCTELMPNTYYADVYIKITDFVLLYSKKKVDKALVFAVGAQEAHTHIYSEVFSCGRGRGAQLQSQRRALCCIRL